MEKRVGMRPNGRLYLLTLHNNKEVAFECVCCKFSMQKCSGKNIVNIPLMKNCFEILELVAILYVYFELKNYFSDKNEGHLIICFYL